MRMGKKIAAVLAFYIILSAGNALAEQAAVTSVDIGKLLVGTDEMNSKMYYDAMDKVAEKLSATFLEDLQMHKLPIDMGV